MAIKIKLGMVEGRRNTWWVLLPSQFLFIKYKKVLVYSEELNGTTEPPQ